MRLTLAGMILAFVLPQAQPTTVPPSPLPGNAMPPFPEAASRAQVEGLIEFELDVDATGRVTKVTIVSVPKPGLGFEEVAQRTMSTWRFTPARQDGQPVPGTQRGRVDMVFAYAPHLARMFPKRTFEDVWRALDAAVGTLGFGAYRGEPADGLMVTPVKKIKGDDLQLHVFVPPSARPVRVYLGSIQDSRARLGSDRRSFNSAVVGTQFFDAVTAALGEPGLPVPQLLQRRVQMIERFLGPEDPAVACLRRVVANIPPPGDPRFKPATLISRVDNLATLEGSLGPNEVREVVIEGQVAEDGHFRPEKLVEGSALDEQFVIATLGPASMSRFQPATIDGCAVPSTVRAKLEFTAAR